MVSCTSRKPTKTTSAHGKRFNQIFFSLDRVKRKTHLIWSKQEETVLVDGETPNLATTNELSCCNRVAGNVFLDQAKAIPFALEEHVM